MWVIPGLFSNDAFSLSLGYHLLVPFFFLSHLLLFLLLFLPSFLPKSCLNIVYFTFLLWSVIFIAFVPNLYRLFSLFQLPNHMSSNCLQCFSIIGNLKTCKVYVKVWIVYAVLCHCSRESSIWGPCYLQGILSPNPWRYRGMTMHDLWCQQVPLKSDKSAVSHTRQFPALLHLYAALVPENCNFRIIELQTLHGRRWEPLAVSRE